MGIRSESIKKEKFNKIRVIIKEWETKLEYSTRLGCFLSELTE
jgi:hypothetical protein